MRSCLISFFTCAYAAVSTCQTDIKASTSLVVCHAVSELSGHVSCAMCHVAVPCGSASCQSMCQAMCHVPVPVVNPCAMLHREHISYGTCYIENMLHREHIYLHTYEYCTIYTTILYLSMTPKALATKILKIHNTNTNVPHTKIQTPQLVHAPFRAV